MYILCICTFLPEREYLCMNGHEHDTVTSAAVESVFCISMLNVSIIEEQKTLKIDFTFFNMQYAIICTVHALQSREIYTTFNRAHHTCFWFPLVCVSRSY